MKRNELGKYRLRRLLAEGGMAEIFLAHNVGIEGFSKPVVLKLILPHLARDPEFVRMFVEEAKLASQLLHPNIVQVHELGSVDHRYFIAMEYIEGCDLATLRDRLWEKGETFAPGVVLRIGFELLGALEYAHQKGDAEGQPLHLVHRDVSPENVLLSNDGAIKLTDFGIAKARNRSTKTQTGQVRGKFSYMAPEQATGKALDHRADLFAVGVILYELWWGKRLYAGTNDLERLERARLAQIAPLHQVMQSVPREISELFALALAPRVHERVASAAEFARLLREAAVTVPVASAEVLAALVRRFPLPEGRALEADEEQPVAALAERTAVAGTLTAAPPSPWRLRLGVLGAGALAATLAAWLKAPSAPVLERVVEVPVLIAPSASPALLHPSALPSPSAAPAPLLPAPRPPIAFGFLSVNSLPWSYVYIDGKKLAKTTPIDRLRLPVGLHRIKLVSPLKNQERELSVTISASKPVTQVIEFDGARSP